MAKGAFEHRAKEAVLRTVVRQILMSHVPMC